MNDLELQDAVDRMILYFDLGVLASYRQESHRYQVTTDHFEGRVRMRSDYYETLSEDERKSQYLDVQFGFRAKRDGSLAVAAWGPDLVDRADEQRKRWSAFHIAKKSFPASFDARFGLWVERYLAGNWYVENGPLARLSFALAETNALTLESVGRSLFHAESSPELIFPSAENDVAYTNAHSVVYGLVIDGIDKGTVAALASRLGIAGEFHNDRAVTALRKIIPDQTMHAAIFDPLAVVSKHRGAADHGVRPPPSAFAAFDQFSQDVEILVAGLLVLRDSLAKSLNLDVTRCMERRLRKSMLPKSIRSVDPLLPPNVSVGASSHPHEGHDTSDVGGADRGMATERKNRDGVRRGAAVFGWDPDVASKPAEARGWGAFEAARVVGTFEPGSIESRVR